MKLFLNKIAIFRLSTAFAVLIIFSAGCQSTNGNNNGQDIKPDPAVVTGQLENGLTYIIQQNSKPSNQASLRLAVKSGSTNEAEDQKGIAHLVEHLAFNGSKHFPKNELIDFLEIMGIEFGPELNAYTSYDKTVYKLEVPLSKDENIKTAMTVLRDWADGLLMDGSEIDKERGVVIQEWRDGLNAGTRISNQYLPILFKDSIYATRKPIGDPEIVRNISYQRIRDFYNEWYIPQRMAIIAVGDFDVSSIKQLVKEKFETMKPGEQKNTNKSIPDSEKTDIAILTDPEIDSSSLWIVNRLPIEQKNTLKQLTSELKISIADKIITNRMEESLNSGAKGIVSAYSDILSFINARSFYLTGIDFNALESEKAIPLYYSEIEKLRQFGISQAELMQAASELSSALQSGAEEQTSFESSRNASLYVKYFTNDEIIPDPEWLQKEGTLLVQSFTKDEINETLAIILKPTNRSCIIIAPESEEKSLPNEQQLTKLFTSIQAQTTDNQQLAPIDENNLTLQELEIAEPKPGKITSRSTIKEIQTERLELSNGAIVYIRRSNLTQNRFQYHCWSHGGTSLASDKTFPSAEMTDDLLIESPIANLSKTEKQQWMKRNNSVATISIDELQESISGQGQSDKIEESFKLLHALFTAVKPNETAFQKVQSDLANIARNREKSPKNYFMRELNQILRQKGDRHPELTVAQAENGDYNEALQFYKERFSDASDFTFAFTGSFDNSKIEKMIIKYIASLPSDYNRKNRELFIARYSKYPNQSSKTVINKGMEEQALIYTLFHGEKKWDRDFNRQLDAACDCLDRQLDKEIREAESGTYSIGAFGWGRKEPYEEVVSGIVFSCDPSRLDELITKQNIVVQNFIKGEFDEQLLQNYKKIKKANFNENKEKDSYWLTIISLIEEGKMTPVQFTEVEEDIDSLTKQELIDAAWQVFNNQPKTEAILLPQ